MTAVISALSKGEPIPVAVVADQIDAAQKKHESDNSPCPDCGNSQCQCSSRRSARALMDGYNLKD